jgi:hypothetical protein
MRWSVGWIIGPAFGLLVTGVKAQTTNSTCISLQGSHTCQNFSQASVSTSLSNDFPFLTFVSTVQEFDAQFLQFIQQGYAQLILDFDKG